MGRVLDSLVNPATSQEGVIDIKTGLSKDQMEQDRLSKELSEPMSLYGTSSDMDTNFDPTGISRTERVDGKTFADAAKGADKLGTGLHLGDDLQDFAALQQNHIDKWGNGLMKFAGKTGSAVVGGVGMIGSSLYALGSGVTGEGTGAFSKIYDNAFHNDLDQFDAWLDGNLPNYISKEEREMGFFRKALTANFWAGDIFGNVLPFVAGAVLTEVALSAATAATGGLGGISQAAATALIGRKAVQVFSKLGKLSRASQKGKVALDALGKGSSFGKKLGQASSLTRKLITGAGYESGVEARHHIDTLKNEFTLDFIKEHGRGPNDEERADIHDLATQSGNWVFAGNLALVGGGNLLQFPKIFGPGLANKATRTVGNIVEEVSDAVLKPYKSAYKSWTKSRNITDATMTALQNPLYEGLIEEGGQGWINNAGHHNASKFWAQKHDPSGLDYGMGMVESLGKTFQESYGTKSAWDEIGMGMLVGGMGLPSYSRTGKKGADGIKKRELGLQGGSWGALRDRKEKRARTDKLVDSFNKNRDILQSLKRGAQNYARVVRLQEEKDGALTENDMFTYKNAENDEFHSFVTSRLEAGMYQDVVDNIKMIEDMDNEEFVSDFGYSEVAEKEQWSEDQIAERKRKVMQSALTKAEKIKTVTEIVDKKFSGIEGWSQEDINKAVSQFGHHLTGESTAQDLNDIIREQLIHSASTIENVDMREEELIAKLDEVTGGALRTETGAEGFQEQMRGSSRESLGARARNIMSLLSKNDKLPDSDPKKLPEAVVAALNEELLVHQLNISMGMQENSVDDGKHMELFAKNNPKEFAKVEKQEEMLGLLRDLRKLRARRQEFLGYYNSLFTKEGQQEALTQVEFFMDQNAAEADRKLIEDSEKALRDKNLKDFRTATEESEFRVNKDLHGDIGYYKWVPESDSVLFNVKDPTDQVNINDLLQEGPNGALGFKPGRSVLSPIEMEQRKIVEAIDNIRTTQPQKIIETQNKIAEITQKVEDILAQMDIWAKTLAAKKDKGGNIRVPEGSVYQTGPNKGEAIPRKAVKREKIKELYIELGDQLDNAVAQKTDLEADVDTLIANKEAFDKLLTEIESPGFSQAMPLNERAAYEASLGRDAIHELGIEGIVEDMAGNTRFKSPGEIMVEATTATLTTDQLLNEVQDMIAILTEDIKNLSTFSASIQDLMVDDELAHLVQEFQNLYPGVELTYPAIIEFLKTDGAKFETSIEENLSEDMFQRMSAISALKEENKLLKDDFFASEEKLAQLLQELEAAKRREAALIDLWESQLAGVEKVQRAITFAQAYQTLQDQLGAIYLEEHAALESPIAIQPDVLGSSLTQDGEVERTTGSEDNGTSTHGVGSDPTPNPPSTPDGPPAVSGGNKSSIALVGWWHTTGNDKTDKNRENHGIVNGVVQEDIMTTPQRRWFKTISVLPESELKELRLTAVTKKTNEAPELDGEFIPGEGIDEHVLLILSNADGTPYKVDGNFVYTSLPVTDPKGEKVYYPKTLSTEAQRTSFLNSRHNDFVAYRQSIIDAPAGGVSIPVDGVSRGSNVLQLDPKGKPVFESVVDRITEAGIESIKDIELFVAVPGATKKVVNGVYWAVEGKKLVKLRKGDVYATYKGRTVRMQRRGLTETEADISLKLLKSLSRGEAVAEGTDVDAKDYLKDILGFRYNTTATQMYTETKNGIEYLIFGSNSIQLKELDLEAESVTTTINPNTGEKVISREPIGNQASIDKVKHWMTTTVWHNVNKAKFKKAYVSLELSETGEFSTKEYGSYEEYLMFPRENILDTPLGAAIVPQSKDISNTQFRGQNLFFPISSSATKSAAQVRKESNAKKMQPQGYGQGTDLDTLKLAAEDVSTPTASGVTANYKVVNKDGMVVGEEYNLNLTNTGGDALSAPIVLNSEGKLETVNKDAESLIALKVLEDLNANLSPTDKFSTIFDKLTLGESSVLSTAEIVSVAGTPVISAEVKPQGETLGQSITGGFQIIDAKDEQAFLDSLQGAEPQGTSLEDLARGAATFTDPQDRANSIFDLPDAEAGTEGFTGTVQDLIDSNEVDMAPATTEQRAKEIEWHKNKFLGLPLSLRRGLIDGTSHGRTINAARVILSDLSTKGTVYHEGVHIVLGRFTTPEARQKLYDAYSRLTGVKVDVEEGMSEEFRNWMIAGPEYVVGKGTRADQTLIQKFFQALKDFLNLLTGYGPAKDRQQLVEFFQEIQATTYSKIEESAYPFKLSQDLKIKIQGTDKNLNVEQSRDIVETIVGNMFKVLEASDSLSVSEFLGLESSENSEALKLKFDVALTDSWNVYKRDVGKMFEPGGYFSDLSSEEQNEAVAEFKSIWYNQRNINRAIMEWFSQFEVRLEEDAVEESKEFSRQYNIKDVTEMDIKESTPQVVKLLIATLPAPKKGSVNTAFGHNLVDGRPFSNLLQRKLSGLADFNDQIAALEEIAATHNKYGGPGGPVQVLIERLKATKGDALTPGEFRMQRLFRQQFHKFVTSDVIALRSKDAEGKPSIRLIPAAGERQATQVIARFSANLMTLTRQKKSMFTVNEEGIAILDSNKNMKIMGTNFTLQEFLDNVETLGLDAIVAGLPYFGIDITSPETLTTDEKQILSDEFLHIVGQLLKRKNVPMIDFFSKESGAFSRLQRIATLEADRSSETLDFSYQSPTGKSMYGVINNTYATNIVGRLNNGKVPAHMLKNGELKEVLQGSIFIDGASNGYKIGLGSLQGVSDESSRRGQDLQDVSPKTLFQTEFISVLAGKIPMLASADSKTEFVLDLTERSPKVKGSNKSLFSKIPTTQKAFLKQSKLYLRQELVQMKLRAGKGNNSMNSSSLYDTYNEASKSLIFYEYMVEGDSPLPLGDLAKMTVDEFLATYDGEITAKLQAQEKVRRGELLQAAVNAGIFTVNSAEDSTYVTMLSSEVLENAGVTPKAILTIAQVNKILNVFNRIHTVTAIEQSLVIFGSPGFYTTSSFFKRTKGANGPKKFADVGAEVDSWLKANTPRRDKKVPDGKVRVVIREDVHASVPQEQFAEYASSLGMTNTEIAKKLANPKAKISTKGELIWIASRDYLDFEEADGTGKATLDEYMEFMERVGDVSDAQRATYAKFVKGEKLTPRDLAIFPVIKPQYFGPSFNPDISAMMMLKFSVVPMVPNSMRTISSNSVLALEADDMEKNKVGLAVFASGTKLGRVVDTFGKSNSFYNVDGTYAPIQEGFIQEIPYEYFGIQVDMEDKIHTKTIEGSQQRIIRSSNIFQNGAVVKGKEDLAVMDQLVNELSDETVRAQFDILADELGLTENDGKYTLVEGGAQRFAEIIIEEAKRRKMGDSYIEGLERFADSPSKVLDLIGNKQRVESLLHSLVANSVVRHKTFGGSKVLVASSGFEANGSRQISDVKSTYQDRHLFGANYDALKFYRKGENGAATTAMEVYLPHYFKELIGENVEIIDGNIYSDGELIGGPELLEIYGFRIPTTALNSMEGIIIKGFLPQGAGDAIMVPSELVVKAGSDYDIDKLTIYLQNYLWDKGSKKLSKVKYLTEDNSTTVERVEQLRKIDPKKYRLLHKSHGDITNLDKHFARLEKDLRQYKKDLYKINNTAEAKEIQGDIDKVYSEIEDAPNKSSRDVLYAEIGLLQSQLINLSLHKKDDNAYQLHDSLPVKITETLNKLEKIGEELDRVLALGIENKKGVTIPMQNAQKAIANETLDLSRAMVLHSANFEQLIRPVGTGRLKTYAEVIRKLKGKGAENKKRYSMVDFEKMLGARKEFWTGKAGLEVAAVETLHQIKAQRVGLSIGVPIDFSMPFESINIIEELDSKGEVIAAYMPVGSTKDVRGENYISEIIGEFTNAFVDVANDPFVAIMNINPITAGVAFAMLRAQIHLSDVAMFTSALALEDYVEAKMESTPRALKSIEEKYKILSDIVVAELPKSHVTTNPAELWTQRHISEMLKIEPVFIKFREAINNKVKAKAALIQANKATGSAVTFSMLENYIHQQQAVIAMYGVIERDLARPITTVSQAVVGDRSSGSPRSRAHARLLVKRRDNLDPENYLNLEDYLNEGVQGGFEGALTKTSTLFNDLFMTEKVELGAELIDELIEEASGLYMPFADKIKFADLVEHNFTSFVLASVAGKNSEAMYKDASRLFQGNDLQESLPRRIQNLKNSDANHRYLILQELFPMLTTKERAHEGFGIENIKRFNKKLTQYESNMLSEDFEALMDSDPALGRDLIKFILLQSGTMTSPITWIHLLPAMHYAAVVEPIIEQYIQHGEQLPLKSFREQFMKNNVSNPIVVPRYTGRFWKNDAGPKGNDLGPSSVRFDSITKTGRSTVSKGMIENGHPNEISVWLDTPITPSEVAEISRRYGEKLNETEARIKLKDEGKKIGSHKLFVKSKASIESEAQFMKFAETHNKVEDGNVFTAYKKKLGHPMPVITWEQQPTLGNGIYFKEYGPPGHMSIIRENNTMRSGVDMTGMSLSEVDNQLNLPQIMQGNVSIMPGIIVNSDTTLAGARLPIFALKDTVISPASNEWVLSMVKLRELGDKYPTQRFLIPPLGLGFAEGGTNDMIQSKITDLSELIKSRPNITIVFPEKSGVEALDNHFENVMKNLTCR